METARFSLSVAVFALRPKPLTLCPVYCVDPMTYRQRSAVTAKPNNLGAVLLRGSSKPRPFGPDSLPLLVRFTGARLGSSQEKYHKSVVSKTVSIELCTLYSHTLYSSSIKLPK